MLNFRVFLKYFRKFHGHTPPPSSRRSTIPPKENGKQTASTSQNVSVSVHNLLNKLGPLGTIHLNRTRVVRKSKRLMDILNDCGIVIVEFEIRNSDNEKIFEVEIQHGNLLEEFGIKLFDSVHDTLICSMHLESDLEIKNLVLKMESPPKNNIGSVFEMRGLSKTAVIKNHREETIYQLFTNNGLSGFGWADKAKILTPEGEEKLGEMSVNTKTGDGYGITIDFPSTSDAINKLLIIGSCLVLMKEY